MAKVSNEPLITVVVPIYKVEEYLDKCVQTIIDQTYKNLEIILVDDGSPDNCPKMCDAWGKKDKRIKVLHKENGGLSDARNAGIDVARGKYITFVDSDDYLELNYISFLYSNLELNKADISMGKQYVRYPKKTFNTGTGEKYILNAHDCFDKLLYGEDFDVSAWAKLYKTKLFKNIRYPKGRLYEDAATTYKLIDKSNIIVLNSEPIYNYIIRNDSISNCSFTEKKMDLITSTKEMCDYIINKYPDLKQGCDRRLMYAYMSTLSQLSRASKIKKEFKIKLMKYIKENRSKILKDKRISKRDRFGLYSTYFGFGFYKICWRIYSLIR